MSEPKGASQSESVRDTEKSEISFHVTSELFSAKMNVLKKEKIVKFLAEKGKSHLYSCWEETMDLIHALRFQLVSMEQSVKDKIIQFCNKYLLNHPQQDVKLDNTLKVRLQEYVDSLKNEYSGNERGELELASVAVKYLQELELFLEKLLREDAEQFSLSYTPSEEEAISFSEETFRIGKVLIGSIVVSKKASSKVNLCLVTLLSSKPIVLALTEHYLEVYGERDVEGGKLHRSDRKFEFVFSIPIEGVTVEVKQSKKNKKYTLQVCLPNSEPYQFKADTLEEAQLWAQAINKVNQMREERKKKRLEKRMSVLRAPLYPSFNKINAPTISLAGIDRQSSRETFTVPPFGRKNSGSLQSWESPKIEDRKSQKELDKGKEELEEELKAKSPYENFEEISKESKFETAEILSSSKGNVSQMSAPVGYEFFSGSEGFSPEEKGKSEDSCSQEVPTLNSKELLEREKELRKKEEELCRREEELLLKESLSNSALLSNHNNSYFQPQIVTEELLKRKKESYGISNQYLEAYEQESGQKFVYEDPSEVSFAEKSEEEREDSSEEKGEKLDDFNAVFQSLMERLQSVNTGLGAKESDLIEINTALVRLGMDFESTARRYGRIIISEVKQPLHKKTIKPVNVGGVIGGEKYVVNNVLFKFAVDSSGIFGKDDSLSAKVAGHELKGLNALQHLSILGLHFPLLTLIDYKGILPSFASFITLF